MVALSHPCGETASVRAEMIAMAAILTQPNGPSASCGEAATASARAKADARQTAADPSKLRVAGKGEAGRRGGGPGDLYLQIQVEPDPRFERRGANLYVKLPISFTEAALGAKVEIPTPEGHTTIKIPPGSQSGSKLRLKAQGMPVPRSDQRGDLFAEIQVVTPLIQDERSKELLRELADLNDGSLRR